MNNTTTHSASPWHGFQLILVQSVVAVLSVGVVLLLRFIGGDVYDELALHFREAMLENTVFADQSMTDPVPVSTAPLSGKKEMTVQTEKPFCFTAPLTGGVITSRYGDRIDPFDGTIISKHDGIDIAAPFKTPLAALTEGVVVDVGFDENGYGHYILVEYGIGFSYLYAHCESIESAIGDRVTNGQIIAFVGSTGRSTGNHVHIEHRYNGECLDPMSVLPEATYV